MKQIKLPKINKNQIILLAWESGLKGSGCITFIAETKTKIYWYLWDGIAKNPNTIYFFDKLKIKK